MSKITLEALLKGISEAKMLHEIAEDIGGVTSSAIQARLVAEDLHDAWRAAVKDRRSAIRSTKIRLNRLCKCCNKELIYGDRVGRPSDYCDETCKALFRLGITGVALEMALAQKKEVVIV